MKWNRIKDGGWLQGRPGYESEDGRFFIAQDYDDPGESQKIMWFVHDDNGMLGAYDTLTEAKASVS